MISLDDRPAMVLGLMSFKFSARRSRSGVNSSQRQDMNARSNVDTMMFIVRSGSTNFFRRDINRIISSERLKASLRDCSAVRDSS